jgi:hypothetical protein
MEIYRQNRNRVNDEHSTWRAVPYRNGGNPNTTYGDIVTDSFEEVKRLGRSATHCRLYDMYNPSLGELRLSKSYSALRPTGHRDPDLRPDLRSFAPYKPKQGEWKMVKDKHQHVSSRWSNGKHFPDGATIPLPRTSRRQYPPHVPADATRFENFSLYWNGRAKGLDYSQPFLHDPVTDTYDITEDRRYQRLYWAPSFIPSQPTARHGRQVLLTAY